MPDMFVMPFRPAYDSNGRFAPGAQAWFTLSETNTPTPVYADEALTIQQPNPLVADGLGKFPRSYLDEAVEYRCRVYVAGAVVGIDDPLTDHDYDPYVPSDMGSTGPRGPSAVVIDPVVPTVTLAPGTPASASAAPLGAGVYQLSLGIPQGAAGLSGALSNGDYGDITVSGGGTALTIDIGAVTLAKMAGIAATSILGNNTGVPTTPIELSPAMVIAMLGLDARYVGASATRIWSVFIPASAMKPRTTNPPAAGSIETAGNLINFDTLDFDAVTTEYAQFTYGMPKSWNEGVVAAQFIWTGASGSGKAVWGIQALAMNHGDPLTYAFGAAQTVTGDAGAAGYHMISPWTAGVAIGPAPGDAATVVFQIYRAGGTLPSDARLIGVRLNFATIGNTDA